MKLYHSETYAEPNIRVVGDGEYRMAEDYVYAWVINDELCRIIVPRGFVFDGASIPWAVKPIIGGRWALGLGPPAVHDLLYRHGGFMAPGWHQVLGEKGWEDRGLVWSRKAADRLFGRHMREADVPSWKRRSAYRAVRLFGAGSFQRL